MATRRQTDHPQVSADAGSAQKRLCCRLVNLAVLSLTFNRATKVPPETKAVERVRPEVETHMTLSVLEDHEDMYLARVHLTVMLNSMEGCLLQADIDYDAFFEVNADSEEQALDFLDARGLDMLRPHASKLMADLATCAGLPPFFLPPFDLKASDNIALGQAWATKKTLQ